MPGASLNSPVNAACKIHLLDLGALKERLGHKWERMKQHVQMFFEGAIRRSLAPGDTFCRSEELTYLVMFRDLSPPEVELKCIAISEEVCHRLFGENGERVSLRNLVAQVGLEAPPVGADQRAALSERLEREGKEVIISRQQEARPADTTKFVRVSISGNPLARHRISVDDVTFVYRPIWDAMNHAVITYLCQPLANSPEEHPTMGFWSADEEDEQKLLDLHVLDECLTRAHSLRAGGFRVILAVPVRFSTVARARSWREYFERLRMVPQEIRRDLAFVIFGIDQGVPHIRLAQELPKISQLAYKILCVAERSPSTSNRFARTGTHGIGTSLDEREDELHATQRMKELAKEAQVAAIDSFVLGLKSTSLALMSIHCGIRYLEGPIVRTAVSDPRHGFVHDVEDFYKAKLSAG